MPLIYDLSPADGVLFVPPSVEAWAAQHHLSPTLLAWLALILTFGLTKTESARWLGVSRQTVQKYCRKIGLLPPDRWVAYVRDLLTFNPAPFRAPLKSMNLIWQGSVQRL